MQRRISTDGVISRIANIRERKGYLVDVISGFSDFVSRVQESEESIDVELGKNELKSEEVQILWHDGVSHEK